MITGASPSGTPARDPPQQSGDPAKNAFLNPRLELAKGRIRGDADPLTKIRVDIDELLLRAELEDHRRIEQEQAHQLWKAKRSAASALAQARLSIARQKIDQHGAASPGADRPPVTLLRQIVHLNDAILDQLEEQAALLLLLVAKPR